LEPQPYPAHGCSELTPAAWLPEGSPACSLLTVAWSGQERLT